MNPSAAVTHLAPNLVLDISEVSRVAGVSSRTLRHYDAIGLLVPSMTRADGRRLYGRAAMLRLQRILILRALGMPLARIAAVIDDETDERAALQAHRDSLVSERTRLAEMIGTIDRTIEHLEKGTAMTTNDAFAGLPSYNAEQQREYEREARQRWGSEAVDASVDHASSLTSEQAADVMSEHDLIATELAALMSSGAHPGDGEVQNLVARHYAWVSQFWAPDAAAYRGLGAMYVSDERFRATYDAYVSGLAAFLRDAIEVFADANFTDRQP